MPADGAADPKPPVPPLELPNANDAAGAGEDCGADGVVEPAPNVNPPLPNEGFPKVGAGSTGAGNGVDVVDAGAAPNVKPGALEGVVDLLASDAGAAPNEKAGGSATAVDVEGAGVAVGAVDPNVKAGFGGSVAAVVDADAPKVKVGVVEGADSFSDVEAAPNENAGVPAAFVSSTFDPTGAPNNGVDDGTSAVLFAAELPNNPVEGDAWASFEAAPNMGGGNDASFDIIDYFRTKK